MKNEILIIDIETTGFLNQGGKIVEVGAVSLDLDSGEQKIMYNQICHERPITMNEVQNSWIVNNSDLTVDQIRHSKQFKDIKPELQMLVNLYPAGATAYNNVFDFGFLDDRGIRFPKKLPCPMKLSTNICCIPHKNRSSGFKWPSVEEAWKFFFPDQPYVEKHRGADDAYHEAKIVKRLYDMGVFKLY